MWLQRKLVFFQNIIKGISVISEKKVTNLIFQNGMIIPDFQFVAIFSRQNGIKYDINFDKLICCCILIQNLLFWCNCVAIVSLLAKRKFW